MIDEGTHTRIPAGDRLAASMERRDQGLMGRCYHQFRDVVEHRPASSLTTAFAVGLGLGAVIGWLLAEPQPKPARWYGADTAERMGHKVLEALQGVLPASIRS